MKAYHRELPATGEKSQLRLLTAKELRQRLIERCQQIDPTKTKALVDTIKACEDRIAELKVKKAEPPEDRYSHAYLQGQVGFFSYDSYIRNDEKSIQDAVRELENIEAVHNFNTEK